MFSIIKNTFKILLRRKSTVFTAFILPIALILLFSMIYGSSSKTQVGIINNDTGVLGEEIKNKISNMDSFNVITLNDDKGYVEDLIFHKYEVLIVIDDDFTEKIINGEKSDIRFESISKGEMTEIMKEIVNSEVKSLANICNNVNLSENDISEVIKTFNESKPEINVSKTEKKLLINDNIGIVFYLLFIVATLSSGFLNEDEKQGTKDRTLMGKVKESHYYGAITIVFFIISAIPALEYFIICNLLDFEFGFSEKYMLLILGILMVILSILFNLFLSSIIKHKAAFTTISSVLSVPIFMLSGAFWDFNFMSEGVQKIGNALPIRWIYLSIENLQKGNGIESVIPYCLGVLLMSLLFFLLSIFFTRNKIVLIKDTTK
ncbi:MAG: ABC transporter permease [Clostridiales bacterium]|nr:ABC transporter permease [Clostridiales bacterium]